MAFNITKHIKMSSLMFLAKCACSVLTDTTLLSGYDPAAGELSLAQSGHLEHVL